MSPDKIKSLLSLLNSKATGQRPGWILGHCPMVWRHGGKDSHPSFAVSHDPKKRSRVKCLACGYSGDLLDLMFDINFELRKHPELRPRYQLAIAAPMASAEFEEMDIKPEDIPDWDEPPPKNEVIFPELWLQSFKPVHDFKIAMAYCIEKRGLNSHVLKDLDVRYDPQQERVCFPFRNFKGELMGLQGRYIGSRPTKEQDEVNGVLRYFQYGIKGHRNSHIWLGEHIINLDCTVVVTEGPIDYAKIFMAYPNVAASFTTGLSRTKIKRLADADGIVTFYDYGKGGNAAREAFEKTLTKHPMTHIIPDESDGDAGAMKVSEIIEALKDHVEMPTM